MRSLAVRAALLLGWLGGALLAPSVRADIVPEDLPRPPDVASAEPGTSATVKVIVVVGGLVLAGILIALLLRRARPEPSARAG